MIVVPSLTSLASMVISYFESITKGRWFRECGQIGVSIIACTSGSTIGPPADMLPHGKNIRPFRLKLEILEEYDEINCGNYTTLRDFILRCKKEFPAERYFLHIHGHGYAWYGACCDNDTNDTEFPKDRLTMKEIRTALEESGGVDILEFTNCVMGNLESAYELRNCTEFYIGSESGVDTFSPAVALINNLKMFRCSYFRSTEIIAKKVVQSFKYGLFHLYRFSPVYFILNVLNLYNYNRYHKDFTFSTIKTIKLEKVCNAMDEFSEFLINDIDKYKNIISNVRNQTEDFGLPLIDIYHFAELLKKEANKLQNLDLNPNIDALIVILAGFEYTLEVIEKKLVQRIAKKYGKPVIICMLVGYNEYKNLLLEKIGRDMPLFTSLNSGIKALSKLCEYGMRLHKKDD